MKIKNIHKSRPLKYRLTVYFVMFACVLLGILWLMQSVFFKQYYKYSMQNKAAVAMGTIEILYSAPDELSYDEFCNALGKASQSTDVMFYVEAVDGSFTISSVEQSSTVRIYADRNRIIESAREGLHAAMKQGRMEIDFDYEGSNGDTFVHAKLVKGGLNRRDVIIYGLAALAPVGPAVNIMRSQLLIVMGIALVLCYFIARFIARHLSRPIKGMTDRAKTLASGNYDVIFKGDGLTAEVDELAATLTETAAELKRTDSLQKDLMANVSHDLRTPLTMIKSYAEMIRDLSGDVPEKRDEHLGVIIEETDRLSDLVNDVLTLSRMQAGVIELEDKVFDLQKAAEGVFSTYLVMEQEGFTMSFEALPEELLVRGDERRIKQVISNLMSNAVRYSEKNKNIVLRFSMREEGYVRCSVIDQGIGIAEADLERIWNRYERGSKRGQRAKKGTGLGLSIAQEILSRHNAYYGVSSSLGEGSEFWFELKRE